MDINERKAKIAQSLYDALNAEERDDGSKFYRLDAGSPEWMTDIIRAAHCDMMPDDWRYKMIVELLCDLTSDDPDQWEEHISEYADRNTDVYNSELLRWLASHLERAFYCDEARDEGYVNEDSDMYARISAGQAFEYREIGYALVNAIAARADEDASAADENGDTD